MKSKRTYKTVDVEKVAVAKLLSVIAGTVVAAIDVAKEAMVVGFADLAGKTHELVRFSHPRQTILFIELLEQLRGAGREVQVAMEPTGVYGNALRSQLRTREVAVYQVDPKRTHDVAAVLDGTMSQHDPKSCTLIAFLHAQGLSKRWREQSAQERRARVLLKEQQMYAVPEMSLYNELEAMTSASWPELNALMDHELRWPLELLAKYPGARAVRAAPSGEVKAHLTKVSRNALSQEQIERVLSSARTTLGEKLELEEEAFMSKLCASMLEYRQKLKELSSRIEALTDSDNELRSIRTVIGPAATLALFALVGRPSEYGSAGALEKACGLNLKERSSGMKRGQLSISKRGPSRVRQLLYLSALRWIRADELAWAWYQSRTAYKGGVKVKAIVAVMRKQLRALFHVARGAPFDSAKLFDARRLMAASSSTQTSSATS
jgi:transposase